MWQHRKMMFPRLRAGHLYRVGGLELLLLLLLCRPLSTTADLVWEVAAPLPLETVVARAEMV